MSFKDFKKRREAESAFHTEVQKLLERSGVDLQIVMKDGEQSHNIGVSLWHVSFLARGEEAVFQLHKEEELKNHYDKSEPFEPWHTCFTPLEKVELFLKEEVQLVEPRKLFANRINRLVEMSHAVGQQTLGEDGWDRPRVELFLYDDYSRTNDWGFFGRRCKSVFSAHRIMYRKKLHELTEKDIDRLESEVDSRAEQATARQEMLKKLFFERLGVFTYEARTYEPSEVRHSFVDGKVIDDSWTERHYFLGQVEVTREEYGWLNTFLGEVKVPDGFVRITNDTHDLLRIFPIPGQNDILVVVGKTGSRRGVWSYGEWFRGHPSKCQISFWHKGTARKIKSVTLNGQLQESNVVWVYMWTNSVELAKRALREAGMNESPAYAEALAKVYEANPLPSLDESAIIQKSPDNTTTDKPVAEKSDAAGFGTNLGDLLSGIDIK